MEIKNTLGLKGVDAQYDERAKSLLGNKIILAYILVKTVDEFCRMDPKQVQSYIEGEPSIGVVPVDPGLTNMVTQKDGQKVVGLNTENMELAEGMIRFDIIFYVRMKDGISQVIINVEAQKAEPSGYGILNRAIFYASRLISSQKERDFAGMEYNDIKRVFSIWICMNMEENSMSHVYLTKKDVIGSYPWKGRLDLFNIVMVGVSNDLPAHDKEFELHRLLGTLLSAELSVDRKLGILETEYDILPNEKIRKDVSVMCNLSQGIFEKGEAHGIALGEKRGIALGEARMILNMYKDGYAVEQIAKTAEKSMEEIQIIIEKGKSVFV